tara:strand:- start:227615 stop:229321 length:1707 start_codon:yes stop_codon:yes gene_type:complete
MSLFTRLVLQVGLLVAVVTSTTVGVLIYLTYSENEHLVSIEQNKIESRLFIEGDELRVYWANDLKDAFYSEVKRIKESLAVTDVRVVRFEDLENSSYDIVYPKDRDEYFDQYVIANVDLQRLAGKDRHRESISVVIIGMILLFVVLLFGFFKFFKTQVFQPLKHLQESLNSSGTSHLSKSQSGFDFTQLIAEIKRLVEDRITFEKKSTEWEAQKRVNHLVQKAAHDIRSPIAALNMLSIANDNLSESEKLVLSGATDRINQIATEFLSYTKEVKNSDDDFTFVNEDRNIGEKTEKVHLATSIEEAIEEKRLEFLSYPELSIHFKMNRMHLNMFVEFDEAEFKRALSNVVNNAAEAQGWKGEVSIQLSDRGNRAVIDISDSGCGMSDEMIELALSKKLNSSKKDGFGLGLKGVVQFIEKMRGDIQFDSDATGTRVQLELPLAKTPKYFVDHIDLKYVNEVVSFDDDPSIVSTFREMFKEQPVGFVGLTDIEKIKSFLSQDLCDEKTLFLVDYDLSTNDLNGIDLIEKFGLEKRSILVTNRNAQHLDPFKSEGRDLKYFPKRYLRYLLNP